MKIDDFKDIEDAEFEYEGRVNDRMTEDDYETQNLMTVGSLLVLSSLLCSMIKNSLIR